MWLDTTNKSLQIVLGGAVTTTQLNFVADYTSTKSDSSTNTPASTRSVTNNTTAVQMVPAPSSGFVNGLTHCVVYNADTVSATVKIQILDTAVAYNLFVVTLATGEQIVYDQTGGWRVLDVNGNVKSTGGSTGGGNAGYPSGLFLDATNKSFEVVLDSTPATNQLDFSASISDLVTATMTATPVETDGVTTGVSAATICAAPASGHLRILESFSIYNNDTAQRQVTFRLNVGGTLRVLKKVYLQPAQALHYDGEGGWYTIDQFGNRK